MRVRWIGTVRGKSFAPTPEFRHRLQRQLGPLHEEIFGRLVDGSLRLPRRGEVKEWEKAKAVREAEAPRQRALAERQAAWGRMIIATNQLRKGN